MEELRGINVGSNKVRGIIVILVKEGEGGMWIRDWRKGWRRGRRGEGHGRNSYLCFCLNIVLNLISTQCSNLDESSKHI